MLYLACAQIFKDIPDRFSQAKVPLAYEVIPMLEGLEHELQNLQNDSEVPDVIRIAAQAALIMVGKYIGAITRVLYEHINPCKDVK